METKNKICEKCGYSDKNAKQFDSVYLCGICSKFAPTDQNSFQNYISEKLDWAVIDTFRKYGLNNKQKEGMSKKAGEGIHMSRAPLGYSLTDNKLIQNEDASKVHTLFKQFVEGEWSLNQLSKQANLSVNGLKKILKNRTYLGEVKFDGKITKNSHKPLISEDLFYAVQRKLENKNKTPTI